MDRKLTCRVSAEGAAQPQVHLRRLGPMHLHAAFGTAGIKPEASPSELLLATLGHCLADRIRANAVLGNIAVEGLVLEIEADLAVSPLWGGTGHEPAPAGFEAIKVKVHLLAAAPHDALKAMVSHAGMWSPVANTLHTPVDLDVTLMPSVPS